LQVPEKNRGLRVVTRRFVRRAHALGLQVHVWTVDDAESINRLLDLGVDGIITDRTDILKDVLVTRGTWREPQ
jgi:glycerophosphoryl diester phosphodiesterase